MIVLEQIKCTEAALVGNNNIKFVMTRFSRLVVYNLYIATKEVAGSSPNINTDVKCHATRLLLVSVQL